MAQMTRRLKNRMREMLKEEKKIIDFTMFVRT